MQRRMAVRSLDAAALRFGLFSCFAVLVAHALVYLAHEYSHSITAWVLGWKSGAFAIDFGKPTVDNFIMLGDVGDGVDYDPIFAAGCGGQAAVIALAGLIGGNLLPYFVIVGLMSTAAVRRRQFVSAGLYWIALMCVGNVWSYVPLRALTTHADIALAARGVGLSARAFFPIVMLPALAIFIHFFAVFYRRSAAQITRGSAADTVCLALLSAYWFFTYFGSAGGDGAYGPVAQGLSIASKYLVFPLAGMWLYTTAISAADIDTPRARALSAAEKV